MKTKKRTAVRHFSFLRLGLVVGCLLLLLSIFTSGALERIFATNTSYYVDAGAGSDSNSGTTSAPFKTISKAISVAGAADTIYVRPGAYDPFTVSKSGTSGSPIRIVGDNATISGGARGITLTGSYLDVSGFDVSKSTDHIVLITGKHIRFSNFAVHDGVNPVSGACNDSVSWGSGVKLQLGAEDITVENGRIYQNCGEGFAVTRGIDVRVSNVVSYDNFSANFYLDNSRNVILEKSVAYCTNNTNFYRSGQPSTGILIGEEYYSGWGAQLENMTVINNVSYGCKGINFYGAQVSPGGLVGALIAHNTVWAVPNGGKAINISSQPNNTNIRILNNIAAGAVSTGTGITASNNISSTTFASTPSHDPQSFRLAANASAINAGTGAGISTDFSGSSRDSQPDIGAFEYGGSTVAIPTATPPPATPTPTATPTPHPTTAAPTVTPQPTAAAPTVTPTVSITCPPSGSASNGAVSISVPVSTAGNYKLWVQMRGQGNAANSVFARLDNTYCVKVGDLDGMPTNSWTWVDYRNGNPSDSIPVAILAAGTHTLTLYGNAAEPGVSVDRVLLTKDTACVPTGNGNSCIGIVNTPTAVPTVTVTTLTPTPSSSADTTPPTISLNVVDGVVLPAQRYYTIQATATDKSGVSRISIILDGRTLTTCKNTTRCEYRLRLSYIPSGNHTILVTAKDKSAAGNVASKAVTVTKK